MAEGRLAVERLLASAYPVQSVLLSEERVLALPGILAATAARGAAAYVASREVLRRTIGFDLHRGVVALGRRLPPREVRDVLGGPGPLVVAEGLNDHENLGALFRNAAALGAGGVVLDQRGADPLYRRSVRVSLGHVLGVPWARSTQWPADLHHLRAAGWRLVALSPAASARPLRTVAGLPRTAVLVGAEGPGLSGAALAAADVVARIPMARGVDSLNVATAAAIALYHLGLVDD